MTKTDRLIRWVAEQHEGQIIKKTNLPYVTHLLTVASISKPFIKFGFEIGLCHDLLEDTDTSIELLFNMLQNFGYSFDDANEITMCVKELTDVYTKNDFPFLSKKARKKREDKRLILISPTAQTVKYADLNDNVNWVLKYDKKNAREYLKKKRKLLVNLDKGNIELRKELLGLIDISLADFKG
ncbi:hypothetical protein [Pedobacter sp. Leaf176]|uniref:hypothetical protein n=1 Tax=Pedobacter sp. Leaf176 TaxID=1736286 RepID=UPI0006F2B3E5|nr:hypothetical protein [Pedobacter sp. Leaf176]KQR72672.1 hypothetical protein ASF92_05200 [Pedobacter sp. Leaf176]